jgi:hypothetical protein
MKAREELISLAKRNAFRLATTGASRGDVLFSQAMDPTEILQASGFSTVGYSPQTGTVVADWSAGQTGLEKQLTHVAKLAADVEVAKAFVRFWPEFVNALRTRAADAPTMRISLSFKEYESGLSEAALRRVAADCGLKVTSYKADEGDYNESGSGMGGYWRKMPSTEMTCEFL